MPYTAIPPSAGGTLSTITGLTDKQVVFGSSTGTGTSSADLTYDDSTNDLLLSASESGGTVGLTLANSSNTASSAAALTAQVAGSSAGNPSMGLSISGVKTYDWRIDNGNSDRLDLYEDSTLRMSLQAGKVAWNAATIDSSRTVQWNEHTAGAVVWHSLKSTGAGNYSRTYWQNSNSSATLDAFANGSSAGSTVFGITAAGGTNGGVGLVMAAGSGKMLIGTQVNVEMVFGTNDLRRASIDGAGNVIIGSAALTTTATDGFLYVPSCAGTPTGVPTAVTGRVPIVVDTTNHKLYFYDGSWRDAGP